MARPKVKLYIDIVSPFAYIAYHILRHHNVFKACDVSYVPIFLGGLMHKCGNNPPVGIKNKAQYIAKERLRWAELFSVPMVHDPPAEFPAPTLNLERALAVLADEDAAAGDKAQTRLVKALDEFYSLHWGKGAAVHTPEVMKEVFGRLFGAEGAEKLLAAIPAQGKKLLAANTDAAFDDGAFGLPWIVCTNSAGETEGFFGVDHMGRVAQFLGLEKPETKSQGWKAVL
ncbi:hypothetical protein VTJ83DRAFT_6703 [Remersonia thermophila]|uniref:Glutathione S-transferase kappa n=1 Tax=Remersonia thermophila TaxID=72144 RepID=A0ABR4D5J1_9PEZI